jgi:hypothetical protein
MREIVKVLPLGLLLPLVIGAASVKPDDAISNISDWAQRFGFEGAAKWLANPAADNRVIAGSLGVAALYAFMVWTVPAIRERRADPESKRLGIHLWTMLFYFMCAALVIGIWRFVPPPIAPVKIVPPVAAPEPPPPWTTQDEMDQQKKLGRSLLIYSPQEIFAMLVAGQNISVFGDRWVKVEGVTSSIPASEKIQNKEFYRVDFKLRNVNWSYGKVVTYFDPKKYGETLLSTRLGAGLKAVCQLTKVDSKPIYPGYSIIEYTFGYYNCELL